MGHSPKDLAATLVRRATRRRELGEVRLVRAREAAIRTLEAGLEEGVVKRAWLIGSAAWGSAHSRSDLDIVVEGVPRDGAGVLWDRISEACGLDVDLLRIEDLEARFRERVLSEGIELDGA